jgi:hypothetical protein
VDYFADAGIRVLAGRAFEAADEFGRGGVLDQLAASALFPGGEEPVGALVVQDPAQPPLTVLGVVQTVNWDGPEASPGPQAYLPLAPSDRIAPRSARWDCSADGESPNHGAPPFGAACPSDRRRLAP